MRVLTAYIFGAFVAVALLYSWVNPLGAFFGWVACLAVISRA
jgi:hypothetical protein